MVNLMSTAWLPNIQYFSKLVSGNEVVIDIYENYQKQSYRNRCEIMTAGGTLPITVPIVRESGVKTLTKDICIDYTMAWQRGAWRTLVAAYKNSPYFEHYEHLLEPIFNTHFDKLIDLNEASLNVCARILGVKLSYTYSDSYIENTEGYNDWRSSITPKASQRKADVDFSIQEYYQVFSDKIPFAGNLSVLDLLMCEGRSAINFLK